MSKINNVAYSWSLIQLSCPELTGGNNAVLNGVTSISWNKSRNVATNYGLGGKPVNRGFGNYAYSASITFDYNTYLTILGSHESIMDIGEFDLIVSFSGQLGSNVDSPEFADTHTVTLKGCIFVEEGFDASQDDTSISHSYDLNPFNIQVTPGVK